MNRRKFFSNLVGSVAVLVTAHALPLQRIKRLSEPEATIGDVWFDELNEKAYLFADYAGDVKWVEIIHPKTLTKYKERLMNDLEHSNL